MGRMDQQTGVRTNIAPDASAGPAAAALQLDRADRALAAQPADRLRRRAGALPLAQSRRHVGRDQPGPDDERSDEDRPERAVLHDHDDLRVAAARPGRIWVGTDDGKVQLTQNHGGSVDGSDARADRRRRAAPIAGSAACSRRRTTPATAFVVEERLPQRRLRAVPLSHHRLRQDVDGDRRQPARLPDQRRRAGSQEPRSADRRQRHRRVRVDRRRRRAGRG